MTTPQRPLPEADPESQEYWDGLKRHELRIQKCNTCDQCYFYPRPFCPIENCHSQNVEWFTASGKGTLHSYVIPHRGHPAFETPYVIAVIELAEGGKMMTNLDLGELEATAENLPVDAPMEIGYEDVSDAVTFPIWHVA